MTDATIARTGPGHRTAFRAATFAGVLRSEWTKLRSVRSTFWALTATVVLGIALGAVISAAAAHTYTKFSAAQKLSWDPTGVSGSGMAIAQLAIAVLGVLCISSEYSSGMIRVSLIAFPQRGRPPRSRPLRQVSASNGPRRPDGRSVWWSPSASSPLCQLPAMARRRHGLVESSPLLFCPQRGEFAGRAGATTEPRVPRQPAAAR